jgi:hypothetical protein
MRRAPSGEELRREALEARRVFAEQSLRMLPRAKRIAREFWSLVEVLERRYAETVSKVWSLFQRALIEDVECYLKALGARGADDLMGIAIECYERLRSLSADLSWHLEWLKRGFVNELKRGYFASGGKEYLPGDLRAPHAPHTPWLHACSKTRALSISRLIFLTTPRTDVSGSTSTSYLLYSGFPQPSLYLLTTTRYFTAYHPT